MALQLDLLEKNCELYELKQTLKEVKEQADNTRRGLFARFNDLSKLYLQQQIELEELKKNVKVTNANRHAGKRDTLSLL